MSEPRRSTRARAREEAAPAPAPEPPKETPSKPAKSTLKRKRPAAPKESTPGTPGTEHAVEAPKKQVLPCRLLEGQPLPTLSEPQPLELSDKEYQTIQQSGVLSASLQRSRATWTSGANFRLFHAFFTQPKKVADRTDADKQAYQRQKEIIRNFPQIGGSVEAKLVIEPHTFSIRLYGPREIIKPVPKKPPTYGQWPNHSQYPQHQQYHGHPNQYTKSAVQQSRPSQPKPPPKPPSQQPTQPPAPDPVIHMLAQRAGTDPQLKAVMKIVAAGQASKEELEFFQGHINELTQILQKQKEAAARTPAPAPPQPPQPPQPPRPPQPPSGPQLAPQPVAQPMPTQQPQNTHYNTPSAYTPTPPFNQQHSQPKPPQPPQHPQPPHSQYGNQYGYSQNSNAYSTAPPPQKPTYRPLVFDFVEGNQDKFYFPSYSFMEWLPGNQGVKLSFLITRLKPRPKEAAAPPTPTPKVEPTPTSIPTPVVNHQSAATPGPNTVTMVSNPSQTPGQTSGPGPTPAVAPAPASTPAKPTPPVLLPPRIEDIDEKNDIKDIIFYQPVTVILVSDNMEILSAIPRAIRPPDVVEKYMDEVFDTCTRAEETFLAFRLPKDGDDEAASRASEAPAVGTPVADAVMGGMGNIIGTEKKKGTGRPRKSLGEGTRRESGLSVSGL